MPENERIQALTINTIQFMLQNRLKLTVNNFVSLTKTILEEYKKEEIMNNLALVKSANFGNVQCDFWQNENEEIFLTRQQVGEALEYSYPREAIQKLHERHANRLDKFSVEVKLTSTDGKRYNTIVYSAKGVYEICRWSEQPKADAFYDFVYEVLEGLRKGDIKLTATDAKDQIAAKRAEAMYLNAITRVEKIKVTKAKTYLDIAKVVNIQDYKNIMGSYAAKELSGYNILPLPQAEIKSYSATEIGQKLGVSANKVGALANKYGLKTPEYGKLFYDKSKYSNKEVETWRYYESVIEKLQQIINNM